MGRNAAKLSLLTALFLSPALFGQPSGSIEGSIEGTVVNSKTGIPIQGVSVYFGTDKGPQYETETDPSGQFRIAGMANGDYGCHFEKSGYISQYSGSLNSLLKPVHIAGQDSVRISVSLSAYAKLRGRVLDPEGRPVVRAKVTLAPQEETTDDQGRFAFSQISPGTYTLKAMPGRDSLKGTPEGSVKRVPGTPQRETPPGDERTELLPTWYPSAGAADLSEPINVRGGDDLFGIDIRLQAVPVYRVRGKVFDLDGKPIPLATITSFSQADLTASASGGVVGAKTGAGGVLGYFTLSRSALASAADELAGIVRDGSFELASVPRGLRQFRIRGMPVDFDKVVEQMEQARKQGVPLAPKLPATAPAVIQVFAVSVVVDHDIDDLEIRAEPAITMEATVGLADTTPDKTPAVVRNALVTIDGLDAIATPGRRTENGFLFVNLTPGEIRVTALPGLAGGYYLSSVTLGGQDITGKPVTIQAGAPPIGVTYKPNGGTVTGTVESADTGSVVLIPQAALDAFDVQYGRVSPTGPGGAFEIGSLAPGSYYAFAVNRLEPEKLYKRAILGRIASAATLVHVTEGAAVSIKPPLVRID